MRSIRSAVRIRSLCAAAALLALFAAPQPARANVTYRPGLMQAEITVGSPNGFATAANGVPNLASNLLEIAQSDDKVSVERTSGVLMDASNPTVNPVTGTSFEWPNSYGVFAYEGEIHVTAGTTYRFYGQFDDGEALVVDGVTAVNQGASSGYNNAPAVRNPYAAASTGWVPFNAWIWDWSGGKAPHTSKYALEWNADGIDSDFGNAAKWFQFRDDGTMSFLRTDTGETFTTIVSAVPDGDDVQLNVSFTNVPPAATLVAYFGDRDCGTSSNGWDRSVSLGPVAAGYTASAQISVTGAATANYLRLCLSNPTKAADDDSLASVFEEWTEPVDRNPAPSLSLSLSSISYTNAVYEAHISSFGVGSTFCDLLLEVSRNDSFDPVDFTVSTSGVDSVSAVFPISGLVTNTTYYARVVGTNNQQKAGESPVISNTTLAPGAPECAAGSVVRGFTTLAVTGKATAFGVGAMSATMRLEASTNAAFDTLVAVSAEVPATLGGNATFEVANLELDTEYRLRLRIVNDWGVESFAEVPATRTIEGPFDASGLSWTFSEDVTEVSVSLNVTAVFAGAAGAAILYCDEGAVPTVSHGEKTVDEVGAVSWGNIPFGDEPLNARVVLTSEVAGVTYTQAWTAVVDLSVKRPKLVPLGGLAAWEGGGLVDGSVFDGDFATGLQNVTKGRAIIVDFTSLFDQNDPNERMYVGDIVVAHGIENPYSIFLSTNGTAWIPVEDAQGVYEIGSTTYPVKTWVKKIKYVVEENKTSYGAPVLSELQVYGYISDSPHIVSKASIAKMYWSNGTMTGNNGTEGFGGGSDHGTIGHFFDGVFNEGVHIGPGGRLDNGGYLQLDFSGEMPGGYFIPEIRTGSQTTHSYSLYYSMDGTTWTKVPNATGVKSTEKKTFPLNETAVYIRCVFDEIGGWTPTFAELQVWGMDPDDVPCIHPYWTQWAPVEGSATCLENGIDEQFCTVCGERVTRESTTLLALGHDLVSHLDRAGAYRQFGGGYIACSRGDWRLDFPHDDDNPTATKPLDLITNRVNGTRIGRIAVDEQFNFTDVVCTSTGNSAEEPNPNSNWGNTPASVIDDNWTWTWQRYWYARLRDDQHVDYTFATEIDLAWIDISVWNVNHTNYFYSVDDSTGEETLLKNFTIRRYDRDEGVADRYHVYVPAGENPPPDIYGDDMDDVHDCLVVEKDSQIPTRKRDENGDEIPDNPATNGDDGDNGYNQYQRMIVRFYEQPIKHLRIRQSPLNETMRFSECHPWGTVKGAGDKRYRKETILILR